MGREFKGHVILAGETTGKALVTRVGFNTLASFKTNVFIPFLKTAKCSDHDNPELFGQVMTGKILCLPKTIGSTSGGLLLEMFIGNGLAPQALLFSEKIDSLAIPGVIMADIWLGKKIIVVDQLGQEFLDLVQTGQQIEIKADGTVIV